MAPHEPCFAEKTLQELYTEKLLYHTRRNYDIINTRSVNGGRAMIFCVEDDNSIRDLMVYTLNIAGFDAMGFADPASFWEAMRDTVPVFT